MARWYKLDGHKVVAVADMMEWARWFEPANRIVAQEDVGPFFVSTVFLGLDHRFGGDGPPLLFETMVFRDRASGQEEECWRCSTWEQAEAQHARAVATARRGLS